MSHSDPGIRLCPEHLCDVFWQAKLPDRVACGEWREEVKAKTDTTVKTFSPFEDYSGNWIVETHELSWIENATNEERARLHRYITDDGRVGVSGHPDRKRINLRDGRKFRLTPPSKNEACARCGRIGHDWPDRAKRGKM
jgi:hypothetical protein